MDRRELLVRGDELLRKFCAANGLVVPKITEPADWPFEACAYYRPTYIAICVDRCARPGYAHRAWSWPGYVIDRTPYGVLQHELGHHVDITVSAMTVGYQGEYSRLLRRQTQELAITGYAPNDAEWFAEIFRLFVTNPDLLSKLRPRTHKLLARKFRAVTAGGWEEVLHGAPARTLAAARRKIAAAEEEPRL